MVPRPSALRPAPPTPAIFAAVANAAYVSKSAGLMPEGLRRPEERREPSLRPHASGRSSTSRPIPQLDGPSILGRITDHQVRSARDRHV
jgi:hypothetical protein